MVGRRGISVLDLIPLPPGTNATLPPDIAAQLNQLSIVEHQSSTSDRMHVHRGVVQSVADIGLPSLRKWPVEAPLLNTGLPFHLIVRRTPIGVGTTLEPSPTGFQLDLFLDRVSIVVPGLRPARLVPGAGTTPAHLVRDRTRDRVKITGSGVLRVASNPAGGPPIVRFVDRPDPLDPDAPSGAVVTTAFEPPHFFIGDSQLGLTVDRLTYDDSEQYTPPEITARGQPETWRGIAIKEATAFFPREAPVVGDLSIGVRDVLLGSPMGMQGEIRVEFGRTPVSPTTMLVYQQRDGQPDTQLPVTLAPSGARNGFVELVGGTARPASVRAEVWSAGDAVWILPHGRERREGPATGYFTVQPGDILYYSGRETASDGRPAQSPGYDILFRESSPTPQYAPRIDVEVGSTTHTNVASISGSLAALQGVVFRATSGPTDLTWKLGAGPVAPSATGATCSLLPTVVGSHLLELKDNQNRMRRLRIDVLAEGDLLIGAASGPRDGAGAAVTVTAVEATHALAVFHREGTLTPSSVAATLSGTTLTVPSGALATVTLARGTATDPDGTPTPLPTPEPPRHVTIEMEFNDFSVKRWGDHRPPGQGASFDVSALRSWATGFTGAQFVVIGRCCDLGTTARNVELAGQRARHGEELLTSSALGTGALPAASVFWRGEQSTWAQTEPAGEAVEDAIAPVLPADEQAGWLIKSRHSASDIASWGDTRNRPPRPAYRRVDIYAVGGTVATGAPPAPQQVAVESATLRRLLIPGADAPSYTLPTPREPGLPFRVLVVVKWDSPTVIEWSDAIPTKAELTISWPSGTITMPSGGSVSPTRTPPTGGGVAEVYTLVGRWSYDARSGETLFSLGMSSAGDPNGLGYLGGDGSSASNVLAAALGLGPALMAGLTAADVDGAAVRIGALLAASVAASVFARNGKVIVFGVEAQQRQKGLGTVVGSRQRLLFDYSVEIGFLASAGGITVEAEKPIRIRYKNVGIEHDHSREGWDRFGLVYEDVSFEIEDPGQWKISGPLGELLRVTGSRAGSGSTWLEVDLAFAIDLGVVTITGATIRLTFANGGVSLELRGLAAKVDVPGAVRGQGSIAVGSPSGAIRAGLDLEVIPAKVMGRAALAIEPPDFVAIEVGVVFAVGIPLANSGMGIYGFLGRFVANGTRDMSGLSTTDMVEREIGWYRKAPVNKYRREPGQWALGLGAIVGTLPDGGFTWNAMGSLSVGFPDLSVVFGIDAKFLATPSLPQAQGPPAGTSLTLLGIIAIDPSALVVGIRGEYLIPKVLRLRVPVSAYFPFPSNPRDAYVRIGADNQQGRTGDPVTLTVLPGTLDQTAWAYLMIEEKRLHRLGGDARFNFDGFSIGFGAGWGIEWSAGPIKLEASAKVLVGMGTKPLLLVGGVMVRGSLSLVVVSISASGEIILVVTPHETKLSGKFCGEVDLFFFSISGCVEIEIQSGSPGPAIPAPDPLVSGVSLSDRRSLVTARAVPSSQEPGEDQTVWPDTVPVVHFSHYADTAIEAGSAFSPGSAPGGQVWSGTSELKYAFRLRGVDIVPDGGSPLGGPLPSVWWLPSDRPGVATPDSPPASEHEGRDLGLLNWNPAAWARNLTSAGGAGDPAETLENVCDPSPAPVPTCVIGGLGERTAVDRWTFPMETAPSSPYPSALFVEGIESFGMFVGQPAGALPFEAKVEAAADLGWDYTPGAVGTMPFPFSPSGGTSRPDAYRLPTLDQGGRTIGSLDLIGRFNPGVLDPEVVIAVCADFGPREPVCHTFGSLQPGKGRPSLVLDGSLVIASVRAKSLLHVVTSGDVIARKRGTRIRFPKTGVRVDLPTSSDLVEIQVDGGGDTVKLEAFDVDGRVVAKRSKNIAVGKSYTFTLKTRVKDVVVTGGLGKATLREICYTPAISWAGLLTASPTKLSVAHGYGQGSGILVYGTDLDGTEVAWTADIIGQAESPKGPACVFLRWRPPAGTETWDSFRIAAPRLPAKVWFVQACGVTWPASDAAARDEQTRADIIANNNTNLVHGTPRPLLLPNRKYHVKIRSQYQGWRKTESQTTPPPPSATGWIDLPEQSFTFRTAAFAAPTDAPVELLKEKSFDARAARRYLIGLEPDGLGAPHFLDDPLKAHFRVDYMEQLLQAYGRALTLRVRRTDLEPASLPPGVVPPSTPVSISKGTLEAALLEFGDAQIAAAADVAPCLTTPHLGGETWTVTGSLAPDADYDLLLSAPPSASPTDEGILIARGHFHTSRYRNPAEIVSALGFTSPEPYPILAHDAIVTTNVPGAMPASDTDFDTALRTLGLDPWPLPATPRTTTLWRRISGAWKLVGVLIETDEPFERGFRSHVISIGLAQPSAPISGLMSVVRQNVAGTRLLLAPSAPLTVQQNHSLALTITANAPYMTKYRALVPTPRLAYQEAT